MNKFGFYIFKLSISVFLISLSTCNCNKQKLSAVNIVQKKQYLEITMDYSTGITAQEMGVLLGKAYLEKIPMLPQMFDMLIARLAEDKKVQCSELINTALEMIPHLQSTRILNQNGTYLDEINGIGSVLVNADKDICGDGKLSLNELYLVNLFLDVLGGEKYYTPDKKRTKLKAGACNGISIYGTQSETGGTLTGRILDWADAVAMCGMHTVTIIKYKKKTIVSVGFVGIQGLITGISTDYIFAGLLYSHTGKKFSYSSPHSLLFDLRYALENYSTLNDAANYTINLQFDYMMNNLLLFSDAEMGVIVENDFTQTAENTQRRAIRASDSELNKGIAWDFSSAVATVNGFALKGQFDNFTTQDYNYKRWKSFRSQLYEKMQNKDKKVSQEGLKAIMTYYTGNQPGDFHDGDIYDDFTKHIALFTVSGTGDHKFGSLEVFFCPKEGTLPLNPDFVTVYRLPEKE